MNIFSLNSYTSFAVIVILLLSGCSTEDSNSNQYAHTLNIGDSPIEITWNLLSNFEEDNKFRASLTFHNTGDEVFSGDGWVLYFNSIRALDSESFLPQFEATHISGDYFKLEPTNDFEAIPSGESRTFEYKASFHSIKKTDAPQGFYFVFEDHIETVRQVEILPFDGEEQIHRNPNDNLEIPTAESRYQENEKLTELSQNQVGKITPKPVSVENGNGAYKLSNGATITYAEDFSKEAGILSRIFEDEFNIESSIESLEGEWNGSGILLNLDPDNSNGDEAYNLRITEEAIEITAPGNAGIFYAIQSLRSLFSNQNNDDLEVAAVQIEDYPRFKYRGMHLDVARNFQSKESVLRLLDIMGMYKMNKFHFHLTDDEGWRLAIDPLPELVEVGGRRGHSDNEEKYLHPAYGSGPDPTPGNSFGSGWYTRDDYIEILKFANDRHIEVIPEVDVPGHARAAIKAMEVRFSRMQEFGQADEAAMYRLIHPEDESEYLSVQSFDDNVMDVCQESTYNFMSVVFDEIIALHQEANAPLDMIHVGGDEVPEGAWEESPACAQYMEEHSIESVDNLFSHFFDRLESMLEDRGLNMAGWEEVGLGEDHQSAKDVSGYMESVVPYVWSSNWGSGREDYAYMLANAGYKVVMSNASNLYLDMAYNKSWQEPGFYWAAMFETKDTYSFIPYDLYKNADHDNYGNPVSPENYTDAIQLTDAGRENILGIQGQLWSETVNEPHRWEFMVLPRLLGLAERAWVGNPSWGNIENASQRETQRDEAWNEFANRLGQFELNRLSDNFRDINYRIPVPGAVIEEGMLKANSAFPGLDIRYELSGDTPNSQSDIYTGSVDVSGAESVTLAIFNSRGRSGRSVTIQVTQSD